MRNRSLKRVGDVPGTESQCKAGWRGGLYLGEIGETVRQLIKECWRWRWRKIGTGCGGELLGKRGERRQRKGVISVLVS